MAITYDSIDRTGNVVTVKVTSSLTEPYYHWYLEGSWRGVTRVGQFQFYLESSEQGFVECQDTEAEDYDYVANAPSGYPARRTLAWVASSDTDVDYYRIEQNKDAGGWTTIGTVGNDGRWYFMWTTARLTDLSTYQFRITPVDRAGNDGTAVALDSEIVVRRPDAEDFAVTFNEGATTVTFSEA